MGFWTQAAGYGMMIGGVAAAPYTGGASLALLQGGAGVLAADKQKEGAKKAATEVQGGIDKATQTQVEARDAMNRAYAPYTGLGASAANALGLGMGLPTLGAPAETGTTLTPKPGQGALAPDRLDDATPTGRSALPRDGGATPQTRAQQQTESSYTPTLGGVGGGLVQMRAPTGEVAWVPRDKAAIYQQRGATMIGGA